MRSPASGALDLQPLQRLQLIHAGPKLVLPRSGVGFDPDLMAVGDELAGPPLARRAASARRLTIALASEHINSDGGSRHVIEDGVVARRPRGRLPVQREAHGVPWADPAALDVVA